MNKQLKTIDYDIKLLNKNPTEANTNTTNTNTDDHKSLKSLFNTFITNNLDLAFTHKYYDLLKHIAKHTNTILSKTMNVTLWEYVL